MSRAPSLPAEFAEHGWREVDRRSKDELDLPFFSIRSHNVVYGHESVAGLVDVVAVEGEAGPRSAFTTALEFSPGLPSLGVRPASAFGPARRHARKGFARSVREDGLVGVERTDARWIERDDGTRARAFRYDVGFPLRRTAVLTDPGAVDALHLRGVLWAAIWPTEEAYAMAGGIYPVETLAEAVERRVPAAELAIDRDLAVDRSAHRKAVARVIQSAGL